MCISLEWQYPSIPFSTKAINKLINRPALSKHSSFSGVVNIKDAKHDFISVNNNILIHKQVEIKNGLVFMRMKKRAVMRI